MLTATPRGEADLGRVRVAGVVELLHRGIREVRAARRLAELEGAVDLGRRVAVGGH